MDSEPKKYIEPDIVCSQLGISPHAFRQLMRDFGAKIMNPEDEARGPGLDLAPDEVERLRTVMELRKQGVSDSEIIRRLEHPDESSKSSYSDILVLKLEEIKRHLKESDEKRTEERDRLLTALVRTNQELQQLRYQLMKPLSRKARRKKSFFARLFGA
ncbi:MAG TPA: hypothetical protein GXX40_01145 [Firmicutes bacterium]|nr:hypothetical protein [Bacillota bacterium]